MKMTLKGALDLVGARLSAAGIKNYKSEAFYIWQKHTGISRERLLLGMDESVELDKAALLRDTDARCKGYPLQYILGTAPFGEYDFIVSPDVLIPREDTVCLVDYVQKKANGRAVKLLDLCCGSGCIGISLQLRLANARVTLADISEGALAVSKANACALKVADKVRIKRLDALKRPPKSMLSEFDFIISNPPYIKSGQLRTLQRELMHEPIIALDGGKDGLDFYKAIANNYSAALAKGGRLVFECGDDTYNDVYLLLIELGYKDIYRFCDCFGNKRAIAAEKDDLFEV